MVHVIFDPNSVSLIHFENQIGGGEYNIFQGTRPYQRGYGHYQNGAGISDFFRSLWRTMLPFVKSAGQTMGNEALSTGSRILDKVAHGENIKDTLQNEALKGVDNLVEKAGIRRQSGSGGIKRRRTHHSKIISTKNLIGKKVKRKRSDAFGFY